MREYRTEIMFDHAASHLTQTELLEKEKTQALSGLGRRSFLLHAGMAGVGALAFDAFRGSDIIGAVANGFAPANAARFGPLIPTQTTNTNELLLALPDGFHYTALGKTGKLMSDGNLTPRAHDGMWTFQVRDQLRVVRNHEVSHPIGQPGAAIGVDPYDPMAGGGTTTLIIDPKTREIIKDFVSLSGTLVNCAGGPTPWNSWVSCEETTIGLEKFKNAAGQERGGFSKPHGYCFEVPAAADKPVKPVPLTAMGRFVHEALAVDPKTGIVYLTEDKDTCGFYRFIPKKKGRLVAGGRLQILSIQDQPKFDTRMSQKIGVSLPVRWVDIREPDPVAAERDPIAVFKEGAESGAATFRRLEGCIYGTGKIFFTSTSGGNKKLGQVWEYTPDAKGDGTLRLLSEPNDPTVMNNPDNLCQTRQGNLLICEDNGASIHLQLLRKGGEITSVVKNVMAGFETREFAGVTFSPDGQTLFLNIQVPGVTFAIWGPWDRM